MITARVLVPIVVSVLELTVAARQNPVADPSAQPQRPVFRAGAHYVRVDAYPTSKDGRILAGLTKDDFEVYEDGKPQTIERADFVQFDTWTPDAERKDPHTQQEAYDLAADSSYRVFVIVLDGAAFSREGRHYIRRPLHDFINRNLGPHDLFGVLATSNSWQDLTLGQKTTMFENEIDSERWDDPLEYRRRYQLLYECGLGSLVPRKMADETYDLLDGLVRLLGLVREERKSIVFVANGISRDGAMPPASTGRGMPPLPRIGVVNGRIGEVPRGVDHVGGGDTTGSMCNAERLRLTSLDFERRFRELLRAARAANVAFYPIAPAGLQTIPIDRRGRLSMDGYGAQTVRTDSLLTLANETDGVAIVDTNDLSGGMRRIADDLQAYYVLGYYTTNTRWDGGLRSIKVRLKPKHNTIRARRQYRAPTVEEITALTAPPPAARATSPAPATPASSPGTPLLVEDPVVYRASGRDGLAPSATLRFTRSDRVRFEWRVLRPLDRRQARILDRTGKPLPIDVTLAEDEMTRALSAILPVAAFARGDYAIELTVGSGQLTERRLTAFHIE